MQIRHPSVLRAIVAAAALATAQAAPAWGDRVVMVHAGNPSGGYASVVRYTCKWQAQLTLAAGMTRECASHVHLYRKSGHHRGFFSRNAECGEGSNKYLHLNIEVNDSSEPIVTKSCK